MSKTPSPAASGSLRSNSGSVATTQSAHLCVFIHGLWGNPDHLKYISTSFSERFRGENEMHVLVPKSNAGSYTYDGIEIGAHRITREIEDEVHRLLHDGIQVDRLSIVGYSLGGIIGRYCIGLLYRKEFFNDIKPMSFTTFATPHLGVRTPLLGVRNQMWNVLGARTLSETGRQLFLIDQYHDTGRPLLAVMCDRDSMFMQALEAFQSRSLYCNIVNDRSAVYYTTAISSIDPYTNLAAVNINYLPGYANVLVDPNNPVSAKPAAASDANIVMRSLAWLKPSGSWNALYMRVSFGLVIVIALPIGAVGYLAYAAIQSIRSSKRRQAHVTSLARAEQMSKVPRKSMPVIERAKKRVEALRERAEEAFEQANSSQSPQYISEADHFLGDTQESEGDTVVVDHHGHDPTVTTAAAPEGNDATKVQEWVRIGKMDFPTLALTQAQFHMIEELNRLGWQKFPVYVQKVLHSHAAIIMRSGRNSFSEGKTVIQHFLDNFKLI